MKKLLWYSPFVALVVFAAWGLQSEDYEVQVSEMASAAASGGFDRDLVSSLRKFKDYVDNPDKFTLKSCHGDIEALRREALELRPENYRDVKLESEYKLLVQGSWELRQSLVSRLRSFYDNEQMKNAGEDCVRSIRGALRFLRHFEDYVLVSALNPREFNDKKDPKAGPVLRGEMPILLKTNPDVPLKIRSGDVLLSRGYAYTSAAIARIGEEEGQFSHLAQIYIDAPVGTELTIEKAMKDKRVRMIEAHIEVGSFTRGFAEYVNDGNSRVLVFRSRLAPVKAHAAAKSINDRVIAYQKKAMKESGDRKAHVNHNPPYDFKMDMDDPSEYFCTEIISRAYASQGLPLPTFKTRLRKNGMTLRMEIKVTRSFAPADMEIEPEFEQVAEWRDIRKIPGVMRKDAALSSMFKWMDERNYDFIWSLPDAVKARIAFTARQLDLGFEERLPKNMNRDIISMTFALDRVGVTLDEHLQSVEAKRRKEGKMRLNFPEMVQVLEQFRATDEKAYHQYMDNNNRGRVAFHLSFRKLASSPKTN